MTFRKNLSPASSAPLKDPEGVKEALGLLFEELTNPRPSKEALESPSGRVLCAAADNIAIAARQSNLGIPQDREDALSALLKSLDHAADTPQDPSVKSALAYTHAKVIMATGPEISQAYGQGAFQQLAGYLCDLREPDEKARRERLQQSIATAQGIRGIPGPGHS